MIGVLATAGALTPGTTLDGEVSGLADLEALKASFEGQEQHWAAAPARPVGSDPRVAADLQHEVARVWDEVRQLPCEVA